MEKVIPYIETSEDKDLDSGAVHGSGRPSFSVYPADAAVERSAKELGEKDFFDT